MAVSVGVEVLISASAAIMGGGVMGALVTYRLNRAADRRRESLRFVNQYLLDATFRTILANNVQTVGRWTSGDRSILEHFLARSVDADGETPFQNGLTPHATLSIVLHFWAALYECIKLRVVDLKIAQAALAHHFAWYADFFNEFVDEYERACSELESTSPHRRMRPSWVIAVRELTKLFGCSASRRSRGYAFEPPGAKR